MSLIIPVDDEITLRLVDWAERHAALEALQLMVYADNAHAIAPYRKVGFVEIGCFPQRTKFGPGRYKDDVTMWRDVRNTSEREVP